MNSKTKLLFCIIALSCLVYTNSDLRFVYSIISNGAKAPTSQFINSIKEDRFGEMWENPDELTAIGIRQQYLLGTRNSIRYNGFLTPTFNVNELQIQAKISNYTLSSAAAYMQGLYPQSTGPNLSGYQRNVAYPPQGKTGYGTFNQEAFGPAALPFNMQVFPISSISDRVYENFFMYDVKNSCQPLYYESIDNQKKNQTVTWLKNFRTKYGPQLKRVIGFSDEKILEDYHYTLTLLQDFLSDFTEGKLLKKLTDNGIDLVDFNKTANEFINYDLFSVKTTSSGETEFLGFLPNITFGYLADSVQKIMDRRVSLDIAGKGYNTFPDFFSNTEDKEAQNPKMIINVVEPEYIAAIMRYMQVEMSTKIYSIPYASSLYFQLNRLDGKDNTVLTDFDYFVDIIFNDIPIKTVSYANLKQIFDNAWGTVNIRWECSLSPWQFWGFRNAAITLGVLLGVIVLLILIVAIILCCREPAHEDEVKINKHTENNKIEVNDVNNQNHDNQENPENQNAQVQN